MQNIYFLAGLFVFLGIIMLIAAKKARFKKLTINLGLYFIILGLSFIATDYYKDYRLLAVIAVIPAGILITNIYMKELFKQFFFTKKVEGEFTKTFAHFGRGRIGAISTIKGYYLGFLVEIDGIKREVRTDEYYPEYKLKKIIQENKIYKLYYNKKYNAFKLKLFANFGITIIELFIGICTIMGGIELLLS